MCLMTFFTDPRPQVQEKYNQVAVLLPLLHNDPNSHLYNETGKLSNRPRVGFFLSKAKPVRIIFHPILKKTGIKIL